MNENQSLLHSLLYQHILAVKVVVRVVLGFVGKMQEAHQTGSLFNALIYIQTVDKQNFSGALAGPSLGIWEENRPPG